MYNINFRITAVGTMTSLSHADVSTSHTSPIIVYSSILGLERSEAVSGLRPTPSASCACGEAVKYSSLNYVTTTISTTFLSPHT